MYLSRYLQFAFVRLIEIKLKMFMNFVILVVIGLIGFNNGILNDPRCSPKESFTEDAKASVSNLCREAKIENDAPNSADFIFTYNQGTGVGYSYGDGGLIAAASVSFHRFFKYSY